MFRLPELSSLIESGLQGNPTILGVQERIGFLKEQAIVARSKLFPYLYLTGQDQFLLLSKNGLYHTLNPFLSRLANLIDLDLLFTYQFDFWGKYRNLTRAAYTKAAAEVAESKEVELIVSTSIATAYFALKTSLQKKLLYTELAAVRKKLLGLQTLLNKKALLSQIPSTYSEEGYLAAKKWVTQIEQEVAITKHLINILRGLGPDEPIKIDEQCLDFSYKVEIPETLNLNLVARRPDLAAAVLRARALAYEVGAAIADFYPNINFFALVGQESFHFNNLFNLSSFGSNLSPAFSLPLFTAGAIRANVTGKKALYNQAVFAYNDLLLRSTQEVADNLRVLQALFEKKKDQSLIVEQASLRLNIIRGNFSKGLDDLLQVYKSEEELILQQLINVELLYEQYVGAVKLIKALGGGYE